MMNYLIDSNIVIDYLRRFEKTVEFLDAIPQIYCSSITLGEVYQGVRNKRELKAAKEFFAQTQVLYVTEKISILATRLVEKYVLSHGLFILDALIAATAIEENLQLVTANTKHFKFIKELNVVEWESLV